VGVARQYCGQLGKQDNCQVAVSLSLSTERGSVPIDWRLYLPEKWAKDRRRRKKAGVPEELKFQTKPQIALEQIRAAKAAGVAIGMVLADAGYGNETAWREEQARGLCPQAQEQNRASPDTLATCGRRHTAQCEGDERNVDRTPMAHGGLARGEQCQIVVALRRPASAGGASGRGGASRST